MLPQKYVCQTHAEKLYLKHDINFFSQGICIHQSKFKRYCIRTEVGTCLQNTIYINYCNSRLTSNTKATKELQLSLQENIIINFAKLANKGTTKDTEAQLKSSIFLLFLMAILMKWGWQIYRDVNCII